MPRAKKSLKSVNSQSNVHSRIEVAISLKNEARAEEENETRREKRQAKQEKYEGNSKEPTACGAPEKDVSQSKFQCIGNLDGKKTPDKMVRYRGIISAIWEIG